MTSRGLVAAVAALALGAGLLAGCDSGATTFPADLAGTWQLSTVNGQPLPYTLPGTVSGATVSVLDGNVTLNNDGTFDEVLHYHLVTTDNPGGSNTTAETRGDVSGSAGQLSFRPRFESSFSGSVSGSTLTYAKQASSTVTLTLAFTRG
jgi:hypothetical protein